MSTMLNGRHLYGSTPGDFTLNPAGKITPGIALPVYWDRAATSQVLDLLDLAGQPVSMATSDSAGLIAFYPPVAVDQTLWIRTPAGLMLAVRPVDLPRPELAIGDVTTGPAAGATITGDAMDGYTLDLVLPPVGAGGVGTAALVDGAVTDAKLAVPKADLATIGNLLTANQASGTDALGDTTGFVVHMAATLASSTAYPYRGTRAVLATATGNSGMTFGLPGSAVAADPGEVVTAHVVTAATDPVSSEFVLAFYDSGGAWLAQITQPFTGSSYKPVQITGVAPAGTAAVSAYLYQTSTTAGSSKVYGDCWGIWKGAGGKWAMPGTPIVGLTDGLAGIGNLLTANQASGTDTLADTTGFDSSHTITRSSEQAASGTYSLKTTFGADGGYIAAAFGGSYYVTGIVPGQTYTGTVSLLKGSGDRGSSYSVAILWWDAAEGYVASSTSANFALPTSWTAYAVTAVAPANAAKASVFVYDPAGSGGETMYSDKWGFWRGAGGQWAMPGVPIVHTGVRPNPSNTAEVQIWNDATATWITV